MANLLFSYPGSKAIVSRWHATLFPRTKRYVTVFGGTAAELMYRPPLGVEVYNDLDCDIHNVFAVLRDPKQCAELLRILLLTTPDGRRQFLDCKEAMDSPNPIHRGGRAWWLGTAAASRVLSGTGPGGMPSTVCITFPSTLIGGVTASAK